MKRAGWWALAALVFMGGLSPLRVQAQTGTNGTKAHTLTGAPVIYYESDSTRRTVGSGQGLPVTEQSPDRSWYFHEQSAITYRAFQACSISVANSYDSTSAIVTLGARNIGLGFYVVPNVATATLDSLSKIVFAVQVRAHVTAATDSASAMPMLPMRYGSLGNSGQTALQAAYASDDDYTSGQVPQNTALGRNKGEFYVVANITRNGNPGWTFVPFDLGGFQSAPPRMSFKVRYIGTMNSANLLVSTGPPIKMTMDVWGWR